MKHFFLITISLLLTQASYAYNPFWVHIDKKIIKSLAKLDKNNPLAVEQFFINHNKNPIVENLGFGCKMRAYRIYGGYMSLYATFMYNNDSLVNYTITPKMPRDKILVTKYKNWKQNIFRFDADKFLPFCYKPDEVFSLLPAYKGMLKPQHFPSKILTYMTTDSGTMYGFTGGDGGDFLENRKAFNEIKDSLTNEQVLLMMYAINPASRLTAIEYYLRHKASFSDTTAIDAWMERNFQEIPEVNTMFGCIETSYDTKSLVYMYAGLDE